MSKNIEIEDVKVEGRETGHAGILQNFTNAILNGEPLLAPGREGINGLSISNAAHLSDWTGDWVDIPVDDENFLNLLNEHRASSKSKDNVKTIVSDLLGTYYDRWHTR